MAHTLEYISKGVLTMNLDGGVVENPTVLMCGVARSGTSILSSFFHGAGLPVPDAPSPIYENFKLADLVEKRDFDGAKKLIASYDEEYESWGFKRPSIIGFIEESVEMFRRPLFLVSFRDVVGIASRNATAGEEPRLDKLRLDLQIQLNMLNKFRALEPAAIFCSFDALTKDRTQTFEALGDCLSGALDISVSEGLASLDAGNEDYLAMVDRQAKQQSEG